MIDSDDALIHGLRARLFVEPRRSMWKGDVPRAHPVAPPAAIGQAEAKLGFGLPALARRIYAEVADGGFGPAYGLFPLVAHYKGPAQSETVVEVRDKLSVDPRWPSVLMPLCDWGAQTGPASTAAGRTVRW